MTTTMLKACDVKNVGDDDVDKNIGNVDKIASGTSDGGVVSDSNTADAVVGCSGHFSCTPGSVPGKMIGTFQWKYNLIVH